ncbi:hypothetical protein F4779DRAFT_634921 [Xylariaceae sp. FL0662B]|nr:hypothetical protein F4779DRAFT_634921 [Xylariaceae sp. FL0662B]
MDQRYRREEHTPDPGMLSKTVILVGDNQGVDADYCIHAHLLAHYSTYYRQELNEMPDQVTPEARFCLLHGEIRGCARCIHRFIKWVYMRSSGIPYNITEVGWVQKFSLQDLIEAWNFAWDIEATEYRNDITRLFVGSIKHFCVWNIANEWNVSAPFDEKLQLLMVDLLCLKLGGLDDDEKKRVLGKVRSVDDLREISQRLASTISRAKESSSSGASSLDGVEGWEELDVNKYLDEAPR